MIKKTSTILYLPKDFCCACKTFQLDMLDAIQFYVSQATVYSSLVRSNDKIVLLASKIFTQCLEKIGQKYEKMDEYKRIAGIKYVKEIVRIIEGKYSQDEKTILYKDTISRWHGTIEAKLPSKVIKTSAGFSVLLTKDYCVLSDVFQLTPLTLLRHYINHVSLTKYADQTNDNPFEYATSFFLQYPEVIKQIDAS